MRIETALHWVGVLFVVFGLLVGGIAYATIDREAYNEAKEEARASWAGETEKATYSSEKMLYDSDRDAALSILFGGILSGLLLIGFGTVIESLRESEGMNREIRDSLNQIKRNQVSS